MNKYSLLLNKSAVNPTMWLSKIVSGRGQQTESIELTQSLNSLELQVHGDHGEGGVKESSTMMAA